MLHLKTAILNAEAENNTRQKLLPLRRAFNLMLSGGGRGTLAAKAKRIKQNAESKKKSLNDMPDEILKNIFSRGRLHPPTLVNKRSNRLIEECECDCNKTPSHKSTQPHCESHCKSCCVHIGPGYEFKTLAEWSGNPRYCETTKIIFHGETIPNEWHWPDQDAYDHRRLLEVVIPEGVTTIQNSAFYNCQITSVHIPEGVTTIGVGAFNNCKKLTHVKLPSSITEIGEGAFNQCYHLMSPLIIPEGVEHISDNTFFGCFFLTSVTLPESLRSIGESAFECCTRLRSIDIPAAVEHIGERAFNYCFRLDRVVISDNTNWSVEDFTFPNHLNPRSPAFLPDRPGFVELSWERILQNMTSEDRRLALERRRRQQSTPSLAWVREILNHW